MPSSRCFSCAQLTAAARSQPDTYRAGVADLIYLEKRIDLPVCALRISCVWSVTTASSPQPNELSCTSSSSLRAPARCAAEKCACGTSIDRAHAAGGIRRGARCFRSVNTANPSDVMMDEMPWLISLSMWYGRPASMMACSSPRRTFAMISSPDAGCRFGNTVSPATLALPHA